LIELMSQGQKQFVVCLQDITQVDTSGLAALVAAHLAVIRRGGRLKLANPTKRLKEVLAMTKLNSFFDVCEHEEDALRAFAEPASGS
jgi:stage II sporulation protein AA (anti-sigma F factor antagonist)